MMMGVIALTLFQVMALPGFVWGEAKQRPGVTKPEEPADPPEIQIIRRVSVETAPWASVQTGGTKKTNLCSNSPRPVIIRSGPVRG
jgi:hypothetical protein